MCIRDSGDTVVVGIPGEGIGDSDDVGTAHIFTRSDGVWTSQQELEASDKEEYDYFGWSVAIDSDTVIVGALYGDYIDGDTDTEMDIGVAYVFTRDDGIGQSNKN